MVTGMASVTITFLAQEIRRRAAREIPKDQRFLFAGIDHDAGRPSRQGWHFFHPSKAGQSRIENGIVNLYTRTG